MVSVPQLPVPVFRVRNPEYAAEVRRVFDKAPFVRELGIALLDFEPGHCNTQLPLEDRHLQQDGYVHAGVQATLADHTAGTAAATLLNAEQLILTAEFKINLLRAAKGDSLFCRAGVLKPGAQLIVAESEVFCVADGQTDLVAKATVTLAVVDKSRI
ncbi:PaaI family thioesterase [Amphritea sp. HPY]|uniref:PaaI family thioesterase n=1 Tax=Amphritea sp. HPY TaxID=3421652 RepID=UPI003D7C8578